MRIMVIGAGGFIGRHLVTQLAAAGHSMVCAGRKPEELAALFPSREVLRCDLTTDTAADWGARLARIDAVVNAAGIFAEAGANQFDAVHVQGAKALIKACAAAGIPRFIHISALGADEGARSRFHLTKREADDYLAATAAERGFTGWTVVRPSLVIGRGGRSTALLSALAAMPMPVRVGPGTWQSQPIHVTALAETVLRLLETVLPLPPRLDVAGPEAMTTDELMLHLRGWLGLGHARFFAMPDVLLRLGARAGDIIRADFLNSENIGMFARGNVGDTSAATLAAGGWRPPALAASLEATPASEADLWHARLYFLRPALRIGLALIWIVTGIVSAFIYPITQSLEMVAPLGLTGALGTASVYTGAAVDALLGLALLFRWRPALIGATQIAVMLAYTVLTTFAMPEIWGHPFGPLLKNIAILLATLVMIALEARR